MRRGGPRTSGIGQSGHPAVASGTLVGLSPHRPASCIPLNELYRNSSKKPSIPSCESFASCCLAHAGAEDDDDADDEDSWHVAQPDKAPALSVSERQTRAERVLVIGNNVATQPARATGIRHETESSARGWLQVLGWASSLAMLPSRCSHFIPFLSTSTAVRLV